MQKLIWSTHSKAAKASLRAAMNVDINRFIAQHVFKDEVSLVKLQKYYFDQWKKDFICMQTFNPISLLNQPPNY